MTEARLNWCNSCDRIVKSEADLDDVLGYCAECLAEAEAEIKKAAVTKNVTRDPSSLLIPENLRSAKSR